MASLIIHHHSLSSRRSARRRAPSGFTFIELAIALVIISLMCVAVSSMTFAALNTDRVLRGTNTGQSEVELAMRRITNNIHEAQTGTIAVGTSTLSLLTQADPVNNYSGGATVAYSLKADTTYPTQKDLMENDQRFGNNILVHNVTTFNIVLVSGSTTLYQVDLVIGSNMTEERHFQVMTRN